MEQTRDRDGSRELRQQARVPVLVGRGGVRLHDRHKDLEHVVDQQRVGALLGVRGQDREERRHELVLHDDELVLLLELFQLRRLLDDLQHGHDGRHGHARVLRTHSVGQQAQQVRQARHLEVVESIAEQPLQAVQRLDDDARARETRRRRRRLFEHRVVVARNVDHPLHLPLVLREVQLRQVPVEFVQGQSRVGLLAREAQHSIHKELFNVLDRSIPQRRPLVEWRCSTQLTAVSGVAPS